jgi:hypothetical protein
MRIEIEQTEHDIAAAAAAIIRFNAGTAKGRTTQRIAAVLTAFVGVTLGVLFFRYDAEAGRLAAGAVAVAFVSFAFQLWPTAGRAEANAKKYARRVVTGPLGHCLIGPRAYEVTAEALRVMTPFAESLVRWPAVGYVRRDDDYLYVNVAGGTVYAIPREAFESDSRFEQFAGAVEAAHRAAADDGTDEPRE